MSRIQARLESLQQQGRKALIPFITAGDPDAATTEALLDGLVDAGVDFIELGMPFSDPMADGPVLQRAAERSLARGTNLTAVLDLVARLRAKTEIPIVLFGYANPFLQFGAEALASALAAAGGVEIPNPTPIGSFVSARICPTSAAIGSACTCLSPVTPATETK
mgnify:CR=1 FL=1